MNTPMKADVGTPIPLSEEAAMWRFFHDLFRQPADAQWKWLCGGTAGSAWAILATHPVAASWHREIPTKLPLAANESSYGEEFIATFEVGAPHPPLPLLETHWNRNEPVPKVIHESILFYRQFGLALQNEGAESPDHLRHQLEFLSYLCGLEEQSSEAAQVAAGRRDYLDRHIRTWVPHAADAAARSVPGTWPAAWLDLLAAWSA